MVLSGTQRGESVSEIVKFNNESQNNNKPPNKELTKSMIIIKFTRARWMGKENLE
jgi:hypothetical protein